MDASHPAHDHPHGPHAHHHHGAAEGWRYGLAIALNVGIVLVQFVVGLRIGSTALLADAGHNLSDVAGLLLAGGAAWLMLRAATERRTYGWGKAGVLAALLNSLLLVFACGILAFEAVRNLVDPPVVPPPGGTVVLVALVAVGINLLSGWLLLGGNPQDVNRRAAVLHLFADAAVSAGVVLAGLLILWTGARWIDPVVGLAIVGVILWSTWGVLRDAFDMALDAAPRGMDVAAVRHWLQEQEGVVAVHDLHIWPLSATDIALTAHLVVPEGGSDGLLGRVNRGLAERFGIRHATVQMEQTDIDTCHQGCD